MKNILVVGGAGYIGSHTCKSLFNKGYNPIVLDNLIYGHEDFVKWGDFILGDLSDVEQIRLIFKRYKIDAVMHFAAFAYVGESVAEPKKYYHNNVLATLNLLNVMLEFDVKYFIFSSTCATYGNPIYLPIDESHPQNPINPYGMSKLVVENILKDYTNAYNFKFVSLRYFNAAGCDPDCEIGENHEPETHLIPLVLDAALGKRDNVKIFGTDYDTRDGSAVRDYIHVLDLAEAHILALEYLYSGHDSDIFNLGNGQGFTVKEVIDCVKKITKCEFKVVEGGRRIGDPSSLIGSSDKIIKTLNWKPKYNTIESIIQTAWNWQKNL
ncbi:UDP-glucose 4-epimerase GalE [Vibrio plantisponsor]|uniref:UDP-glucose 4-epimerase n=1 Tax=Vibrio plantisponsor TaxID=664643 RepID=A0ABU4IIC1_9VIBR|nr:UDP-glucose 4-epimerase GalE [Vibrio plantisponsor]MDW6018305.1 UDP-glucose 4-epimerase GalE [Vibrio plantisponsor]NNM41890.1 UDP-glucose 4-epimerase GalE [Vibrio plantisponsor]